MSSVEIHQCLKCGKKFFTRDPSMLYCNEGCKWDSTHTDDKLLKELIIQEIYNLEMVIGM